MAGKEFGIQTLQVWQRSIDFCVHICKIVIPKLPIEEKYALTSQLRRSLQSIPANIAEGYGRFNYQEGSAPYSVLESIEYPDDSSLNHQLPDNQSPDH